MNNYGGKKAALKYFTHRLSYSLGLFRHYTDIDWERVSRLIFVCKGNICRSPYAEVKAHEFNITAVSFGLLAVTGKSAYPSAIHNAKLRGIDLSQHKSKTQNDINFSITDLLIGMEPWHASELEKIAKISGAQITLLGLWNHPKQPYIHDPYGNNDEYFQRCYDVIDNSVFCLNNFIKNIKR